MARRPPNTPPQPADLSADQIRKGIRTLERRLGELKTIDFSSIQENEESRLEALSASVNTSIDSVFPPGTVENYNFSVGHLWRGSMTTSSFLDYGLHRDTWPETRAGWQKGFEYGISKLESAIKHLSESLSDMGETVGGRASIALQTTPLHQAVQSAVQKKFADGHYSDAVETACKVLNSLVQVRSGCFDLDNTKLMLKVFSKDNPILRFNDLTSDDLRNEQQGMMFLFCGAIQALRNPRAHRVIEDHPEMAMEAICFISMLAKYLESSIKVE